MKNYTLSHTYIALYRYIIEDILFQILKKRNDLYFQSEEMPCIIGENFEKYKNNALKKMSGSRLDRHKLASCICGAIIESKPLVGKNGVLLKNNANEIFALATGLGVIKFYMMYTSIKSLNISEKMEKDLKKYIMEEFDIEFPSEDENICDTQNYQTNLINSLYWTHKRCDITEVECFQYDIWAYSKIFYHLELYNRKYLNSFIEKYLKEHEN